MVKGLGNWLKIYEDEIALFFWVVLLLFLIRTSSILFNNFAETAFLKRFGVEYLPIVQVINSFSTFFIMAFITGLMARIPGSRMLGYLLLFCGISVAALRLVVPLGFDLIYPLLYILKAQYEALLVLVFWNLANDLFNTRQSKRLFPLITAGGVVGGIVGSFATPPLAKFISMDNLMVAYLLTTSVGAVVVKMMGIRFPALLVKEPSKKKKQDKKGMPFVQEFKDILPLMKQSTLVKILILLTLLPNVAIPIINYQFSYAVNDSFATQGGMLNFFGYFRGAMNIVSLFILLFVGRVYGKWGLPVVLMFHPVNYMIAFAAFLLRFDIFSAMYARISTNVIRTTMNNPARAVLMGLFPVEYRAVIRPFLRGTVVRIGILAGSGIIIASEGWFHPRYLSIAAMMFVGAWILTDLWLKKSYSNILLDLITRNILDLKTLEEKDLGSVFADKTIQSRLVQEFLHARGRDAVWYAELLKPQRIPDFDKYMLQVIEQNDDPTRIQLLSMLSPEASQDAVPVLKRLVDPEKRGVTIAAVKAANRLPPELAEVFAREIFETQQDPEVRAHAVTGLYRVNPEKYRKIIDAWLDSGDPAQRRAGVIAAGESQDPVYTDRLKALLDREEDQSIIPHILTALRAVNAEETNDLAAPYLQHPTQAIRRAALDAFEIVDDGTLRTVIRMMSDPSEQIHTLAKEKIETSEYESAGVLVESLNIPHRQVREGIFDLLDTLGIKDLDVLKFARSQVERCYSYVAQIEALKALPESTERDLLVDHVENKKQTALETVLRVLATEDRSGRMRAIWRGIFSADQRRRSNGLEALDDLLDASLSKVMLPLLENLSPPETLTVGQKNFKLPDFTKMDIRPFLLEQEDWMTVVLALYYLTEHGLEGVDEADIQKLTEADSPYVQQMARRVMHRQHMESGSAEEKMESEIAIPDKILRLKGINIFEGLAVGELGAVATITEVVEYPAGETVIKQGEPGETMYLVIEGEVSVIKEQGEAGENDIELARIGAGDYFGEMALFEDAARSATIRTAKKSRFLVLHKQEFTEIVREYPQIALRICKALSGRIRQLHEKVQQHDQ